MSDRERKAREVVAAIGVEIQRPYPESAFEELTSGEWAVVRNALRAVEVSLDRVSASNMRHVGKVMAGGNERFEAIVLALTAAAPTDAWRPIETAPKDATTVLIACPGGVLSAWWDAEFDWRFDEDEEECVPISAWTNGAVEDWGMEEARAYEPTHWMPLPASPQWETP